MKQEPKKKRQFINRFNNIEAKEWLLFQKSWFHFSGNEELFKSYARFFVKYNSLDQEANILYLDYFKNKQKLETLKKVGIKEGAKIFDQLVPNQNYQLIILDLRHSEQNNYSLLDIENWLNDIKVALENRLYNKRFLTVFAPPLFHNNSYIPLAWHIAHHLSSVFHRKDEKVALEDNTFFYALHFRKEIEKEINYFSLDYPQKNIINSKSIPQAEIIKPPPRKKDEILHPAKFPEDLIERFIKKYTNINDLILDPMCGTASSLIAAASLGRRAIGFELSPFFTDIAQKRIVTAQLEDLVCVYNKDARDFKSKIKESVDYIITSPPYWDMLNMKGAEYQARRKEKGLQLNYSNDPSDFGNINSYDQFLEELTKLYIMLGARLKSSGKMTIIVKNIKKKGFIYPLAEHLYQKLSDYFVLETEFLWLQDDIRLAPYGYGNTFVSNTFHQYCLTFTKKDKET